MAEPLLQLVDDDSIFDDPEDTHGKRVPLKDRTVLLEQQVKELQEVVKPGIWSETQAMAVIAELLSRFGPRQRQRIKSYLSDVFGTFWDKS